MSKAVRGRIAPSLIAYPRRWLRPTFFISTPDYTYLHSGVRCLHLLCHHLNRLGYRAFVTTPVTNPDLMTPHAEPPSGGGEGGSAGKHVVVYPEVFEGNRYNSRRVVRYLLNRPGTLTRFGMEAYGKDEFFIHFAKEFVPEGIASHAVRIPLVDTTVFRPPGKARKRRGFICYTVRHQLDAGSFPPWMRDVVTVSRRAPLEPRALARLYRTHRALVTGERTAAVMEAMHCGCPTIVVPHAGFNHQPIIDFLGGNGIGVGLDRQQLGRARQTVGRATECYGARHADLDRTIHDFVSAACRFFRESGR